MEVTDAMIEAALDTWFNGFNGFDWRRFADPSPFLVRTRMKAALEAALAAAPSGNGERG